MTKALGSSEKTGPVGKHDLRVNKVVSTHGAYGKGYLTLEEFQSLYLKAVVGTISSSKKPATMWQQLRHKNHQKSIQSVWRDLRNHGILSPAENQRKHKLEEINSKLGRDSELSITVDQDADTLLDECEIIDFDDGDFVSDTTDREGTSSHEDVQLVPGSKTPAWIKDGEFGKWSYVCC